jgi:hypothetical protein
MHALGIGLFSIGLRVAFPTRPTPLSSLIIPSVFEAAIVPRAVWLITETIASPCILHGSEILLASLQENDVSLSAILNSLNIFKL